MQPNAVMRLRRNLIVCFGIAASVPLVEASVADTSVPVGFHVFASGLARLFLSALALPPASRVAGRFPLPFRPAWGAEAEAPLGYGVVSD
jgi:hypothetical protein